MAWTEPKTWTPEVLTSFDMNKHIRDNLNALRNPARATVIVNNTDFSTSSETFVDVDGSILSLSLQTDGGDIMVGFQGKVDVPGQCAVFFTVDMDGQLVTPGDSSIICLDKWTGSATYKLPIGFVFIIENVLAGSHTLKLKWRKSHSSPTLYASNSEAVQFWAQEVF